MHTNRSLFGLACRAAAFSFLVAGSASLLHAQQPSPAQTPVLVASEAAPLDLAAVSSSSSSISSDGGVVGPNGEFMLSTAALSASQPPPRRYGRPNYSDSHSNPDGSPKYTFLGGAGLNLPVGNTHYYDTPSYSFQVGGGRNFNKNVAVLLQFDYDHFGLQGATLANQTYIYNYPYYEGSNCTSSAASNGYCVQDLDGNAHVWSFTLNPTYTLSSEGSWGSYLVVGGGFFHKVTNFAEPSVEEECDLYGCGEFEADANIDHYTSNAFGVNGGFGITYKFSKFSNERFYMEARYDFMLNSQRQGYTARNVSTTTYTGNDAYPANSNRTTFIPINFGIRF